VILSDLRLWTFLTAGLTYVVAGPLDRRALAFDIDKVLAAFAISRAKMIDYGQGAQPWRTTLGIT